MDNEKKVLQILKEPNRPGDIAEKSGIDKVEVSKIIDKLKKEDKIYSPKRCFYQVK